MVCGPSEMEVAIWGPILKECDDVVNQLHFLSDGFLKVIYDRKRENFLNCSKYPLYPQ